MVDMTPKEAIERLERLQEPEPWESQIDSEMWQALEMGIDAIKILEAIKTLEAAEEFIESLGTPITILRGTKYDCRRNY